MRAALRAEDRAGFPVPFTQSDGTGGRRLREIGMALLFLAPAVALIAFIYGYPLVQLVKLSTREVITYKHTFNVGLDNYRFVIHDPFFWNAFRNNLRLMLAVLLLVA